MIHSPKARRLLGKGVSQAPQPGLQLRSTARWVSDLSGLGVGRAPREGRGAPWLGLYKWQPDHILLDGLGQVMLLV